MKFNCSVPGCPMTSAGCPQCITGTFARPIGGGYPPTTPPMNLLGCICPPGSEKTCEGISCPRRNPFKNAAVGHVHHD